MSRATHPIDRRDVSLPASPSADAALPSTADAPELEAGDAQIIDLHAWRVRVTGSASHGSRQRDCAARRVDADGMVLEAPAPATDAPRIAESLGRYVWLDVALPDGADVRALGEVVARQDAVDLALEVKFKHLFPDARRRLLRALGR